MPERRHFRCARSRFRRFLSLCFFIFFARFFLVLSSRSGGGRSASGVSSRAGGMWKSTPSRHPTGAVVGDAAVGAGHHVAGDDAGTRRQAPSLYQPPPVCSEVPGTAKRGGWRGRAKLEPTCLRAPAE